jgi:transposase InsO family protein
LDVAAGRESQAAVSALPPYRSGAGGASVSRAASASRYRTPTRRGERWSMDFTLDTLADGRTFRTLNIVDDYTRE